MTNYKPTLQECAMRYGTGMGLLWAFKFMLFPLGLRIPFLQLLFIVLTIGVPFLGYIFAKKFRERHCDGSITFSRAFLFTTFMYMFASLFVAVVHYIYFRYIDGGFVFEAYRSILNQFKETAGAELTTSLNQFEEAIDLLSGLTPLEMTFQLISQNMFYGMLSGIKNLHDFNCGLKAYRRDVVKNIEVYGEMHRYIPYLAKNAGFPKIAEKVVHHQARKFGKTKFGGLNRFFNGYLDLITLWFLSKFGIKPMHFFGFMGSLMFILGFISVIIIGANKLYALSHGLPYILITDSPYFYLALTLMILGTQLFLAGFIGELIARNAPERNNYKIEKEF